VYDILEKKIAMTAEEQRRKEEKNKTLEHSAEKTLKKTL